jgi:addiction module HigA family antidote
MVRIPTHRAPIHPGEILLEEFLAPMNVSQRELADAIRVPYQRVNELVNGRRGITPETALRLAKYFAAWRSAKRVPPSGGSAAVGSAPAAPVAPVAPVAQVVAPQPSSSATEKAA